jgi:hypothetical protein
MNRILTILFLTLVITGSCTVEFIPEFKEEKPFLVVDGIITDQKEPYRIELSWSYPLNSSPEYNPVAGFMVYVTDDTGNSYSFTDTGDGIYVSDPESFRGVPGRKYVLHLEGNSHIYESEAMEMVPVPPVDSLYAEVENNEFYHPGEITKGMQVYADTRDPEDRCRFFRWEFEETWEFKIPWDYFKIVNRICWKSDASDNINIKTTSAFAGSSVYREPILFISTETDRLMRKYSLLLKQYSLNEKEFIYWDNLRKTTEEVGGLYDIVPSSVSSNIICTDDPSNKVLGYFSVSSVATKRLFIKDTQMRFPEFYTYCPFDTILVTQYDPVVHGSVYILREYSDVPPDRYYYILSDKKECTDCTLTGSGTKPDYWDQPDILTIYQSLFDEKEN